MNARDLRRIPLWVGLKLAYTLLPVPALFRLARVKGLATFRLSRKRHRALRHLTESFGGTRSEAEIRRIARRHFQFLEVLSVAEVWPQLKDFAGAERCAVEGLGHLDAALAEGKGAIVAATHFGCVRLIKPLLRMRGYPVLQVGFTGAGYRVPGKLTRVGLFVRQTLLRLPSIGPKGSRYNDIEAGINLRPLLAALARNEVVVMLADGRGAGSQQPVRVVGRTIRMTPGLFTVAQATAAAVIPAFVVDGDGRGVPFRLEFCAALDPPGSGSPEHSLELFAAVYERYIERYPHLCRWSARHFDDHERGVTAEAAWRSKARQTGAAAR